MNNVLLIGRLVRDTELKYTSDSKAIAKFTIAVDRPFAKDKADFLDIVVFGKPAENCANYLSKGRQCAVQGRIQIDSYNDKEGNKKYKTEIIADRVEFLEKCGKAKEESADIPEGFAVLEDDPDSLPF